MKNVFLSLGSNMGNRILNIENALKKIAKTGNIIKVGCFYETEPWGFFDENWFINTCVLIETHLKDKQLLKKCLSIEKELGRIRKNKKAGYHSRLIDIDILFFDKQIVDLPGLIIPHEHLHKRKFVLAPLNDIAPEFIHPVLKQSVKKLFANCFDETKLKKLDMIC